MTFNFKKIVLSVSLVLASLPMMAGNNTSKVSNDDDFDWDPVIDAIMWVESKGNSYAKSGIYAGALQIAPVCVEECNNILKIRGIKKRYSLQDRFSEKKSREMFKLIQSYFNPTHNVEKAIRSWQGGQRYTVRGTNRYYNKVMAAMGR